MAKKHPGRVKHVPQRMCIACRESADKRSLVRIVRTETGVQVDPGGKLPGRGAYLHARRTCWERALGGNMLQRALRTRLTAEDRERLAAYAEQLIVQAEEN